MGCGTCMTVNVWSMAAGMGTDGPNLGWGSPFWQYWLLNGFLRHSESATKQSPLDIARERYAKGEITKEQFEQIKKDLGS